MESAILSVVAHFADSAPSGDRRQAARRELRLGAGSTAEPVTILNISATGMLIECSTAMLIGSTFLVHLPNLTPVMAEIVWNRGDFYGCELDRPISPAVVSAALLQGEPRRG